MAYKTFNQTEPLQITIDGQSMGSLYHVKYIDNRNLPNLPAPKTIQHNIESILKRVNDQMSTYQTDSQISRFNQLKAVQQEFAIDADFATVVTEAMRLHQITAGGLDVSIGPLVNLWGFGPHAATQPEPNQAQIEAQAALVGMDKFKLIKRANQTLISKLVADFYLDLSSIAKGFGVDQLANYLQSLGLTNYLVDIGGEMRIGGCNLAQKPWRIAIEQPETQGQTAQIILSLSDCALATSGNYRNYHENHLGQRLSHIIDPATHRPVSHHLASLSVIASTSMTADGLATGLYIQGADRALQIAEQHKLAVFVIEKVGHTFATRMSSEFEKLFKNLPAHSA